MKRDAKYGVGKTVSSATYVHRSYEHLLPVEVQHAKALLPPAFPYAVVKYNTRNGEVTFLESSDFDTAPEPTVERSCKVTPTGRMTCRSNGRQLYHHKWLFVQDDYRGFNVAAAKTRSALWADLPHIDQHRIGNKIYWEREVVPRIAAQTKALTRTGEKAGAPASNSIITRHLLCSDIPRTARILDFGAGKHALQTRTLRAQFPRIIAYDLPEVITKSEVASLFDGNALQHTHNVIVASNVLNVQPSQAMLARTLNDIYCHMKAGTTLFTNVPRAPLKYPLPYAEFVEKVEKMLGHRFGEANVQRIKEVCGKPTTSTLFAVTKQTSEHDPRFCAGL